MACAVIERTINNDSLLIKSVTLLKNKIITKHNVLLENKFNSFSLAFAINILINILINISHPL